MAWCLLWEGSKAMGHERLGSLDEKASARSLHAVAEVVAIQGEAVAHRLGVKHYSNDLGRGGQLPWEP